jgi:DNA-binding NtrC family response regulator
VSFADARTSRRGLVETANGGTLFLDEIGELPLGLQAKLLTFLYSVRFRRLGWSIEQTSTARIIAATNRNLEAQIAAGAFRHDLWFRLSVFRIEVPPLRDRREDILPLAGGILADLCDELGKKSASLGAQATARLLRYTFPGNVRELRNVLERALVLESGPELTLDTLAASPAPATAAVSDAEFKLAGPPISAEELEKRYARWALEQLGGRRMEAAKALDLSYPTFLKRIGE